jgi:hypothetical protein
MAAANLGVSDPRASPLRRSRQTVASIRGRPARVLDRVVLV